jgi:hypothetical protein
MESVSTTHAKVPVCVALLEHVTVMLDPYVAVQAAVAVFASVATTAVGVAGVANALSVPFGDSFFADPNVCDTYASGAVLVTPTVHGVAPDATTHFALARSVNWIVLPYVACRNGVERVQEPDALMAPPAVNSQRGPTPNFSAE